MTTAEQAIEAARDRLATARFGLADMNDPKRARSGLYNAVVFGRMVTFALQNMRNQVDGFDEWYAPIQNDLRADPLMNYFWNLRTEIEKKADRQSGSYAALNSFSSQDLAKLPRPPGAFAFFVGDQNGGMGWQVKAADGTVEHYYIDPPPGLQISTGLLLSKAPEQYQHEDARSLVARYLDRMESIVTAAYKRFMQGEGN